MNKVIISYNISPLSYPNWISNTFFIPFIWELNRVKIENGFVENTSNTFYVTPIRLTHEIDTEVIENHVKISGQLSFGPGTY